jgi:hypothetical protein
VSPPNSLQKEKKAITTLCAVIKSGDTAVYIKRGGKKDLLVSNKFTLGSQLSQ